jgi:cyclopropane fatty-acyl-phospholipid synthase-like methyltransferase
VENYETKIYEYYNSVSNKSVTPNKSRKLFFTNIINQYFPLDKNITICELGAGGGLFQLTLKEFGYKNSFGLDTSKEQVALAKIQNIDVRELNIYEFIEASIKERRKYDVIIAIDVFEHFAKDDLFDLINKLNIVLNNDGMVVSHQPNAQSPFFGNIRYGDFTHHNAFTNSSISQVFLANNFLSVDSYEDKPLKHTFKSKIRYVLWEYLVRKLYCFLMTIETGSCKGKIFSQNFLTIAYKGRK